MSHLGFRISGRRASVIFSADMAEWSENRVLKRSTCATEMVSGAYLPADLGLSCGIARTTSPGLAPAFLRFARRPPLGPQPPSSSSRVAVAGRALFRPDQPSVTPHKPHQPSRPRCSPTMLSLRFEKRLTRVRRPDAPGRRPSARCYLVDRASRVRLRALAALRPATAADRQLFTYNRLRPVLGLRRRS